MTATEYLIKIHPVENAFSQEEKGDFANPHPIVSRFSMKERDELTKKVDSIISSLKTLLRDFENIKNELEYRTEQDKENQSANQNPYEFSFERMKEAQNSCHLSLGLMTKDLKKQLETTFETYKYFKRLFNSPDLTENESIMSRIDLLRVNYQNLKDSTLVDLNKIILTANNSPRSKLHIFDDRENDTLSILPGRVSIYSDDPESSPYKARERLFTDISPIHLPQGNTTFSRHCYLIGGAAANSGCQDDLVDKINSSSISKKRSSYFQPENRSNSNVKRASPSLKAESEKDMSTELSIEFEVAEDAYQETPSQMILGNLD